MSIATRMVGLALVVHRDVGGEDGDAVRHRMGRNREPRRVRDVEPLERDRLASHRAGHLHLEARPTQFGDHVERASADQFRGRTAIERDDAGMVDVSQRPRTIEHRHRAWGTIQHAEREGCVGGVRSGRHDCAFGMDGCMSVKRQCIRA